jgi:hypothetical protein
MAILRLLIRGSLVRAWEYLYGSIKKIYQGHLQTQKDAQSQRLLKEIE